jgi:hypothetical protein
MIIFLTSKEKMKLGLSLLSIFAFVVSQAQLKIPQASPSSEVEQEVGLTEVEVNYSRPGMKGRKIFGDLVPYGQLWRTGANSATTIEFEDSLMIGKTTVAPGTYAIFTIPDKKEWTVIINDNHEQGGTGDYDSTLDVLRFKVTPEVLKDPVETFTIDFQNLTINSADLILKWENTAIRIPLIAEVDRKVESMIKDALAAELQWSTYYNSAKYYFNANKDIDQALEWINECIKYKDDAYWIYNLKAEILLKKGMKKEAIETAKIALKLGGERYQKRYDSIVKLAKD